MKKKLLYIVLVWLAGIGAAFGQVTGRVFLDGKTDHSGVKVKFVAQTPSAKTDSTFSIADGSYTKTIQAGYYKIYFSKVDFGASSYKQELQILLNNTTILDSTSLFGLQNYLKGNIKGRLKTGQTYIINDEVTILDKDTLIIEKGVKIYFDGPRTINLYGTLLANGEKNDSIYFQSISRMNGNNLASVKWNGIFQQGENYKIKLDYCVFKDAELVIFSFTSGYMKTQISNSSFTSNDQILSVLGAVSFSNNTVDAINSGGKINILNKNTDLDIIFKCNKFTGNDLDDLASSGYINISNGGNNGIGKVIFENNIWDGLNFTGMITHNGFVFKNNYVNSISKMEWYQYSPDTSKSLIVNNTFNKMYTYYGAIPDRINTMNNIFNDKVDYRVTPYNFDNNLFRFPSKISEVEYFGQKITTNTNGDSVDTYFNLFEDPKFLDGNAPYLASNSPAIGAGIDEEGNPTNIGFDPTGTCLESYFSKPNPVVSADTLSIAGLVHQGSGLLSDGVVMAVEKASGKARYQKVSNGVFKLDSLRKSEYILYAIPNPVTVTGYLPTYYVNKVKLSEATPLNLLGKIKDVDIYLAAKPSVASGNYTIQGRFSYADNNTDDTTVFAKSWFATSYTPASPIVITENPCKNLPVVLYNNNNQLVQSTVTDLDGYFVFNNLTSGTYKAQGQRVNYTTENNGVVQVGNTTTETANLRLEQMLDGLEDENAGNVNAVVAYPNPFKDELQLKGYKGAISIHDLTGNLYFETTISENETIDASNWPSGFYLLKIGNKVQKLAKQD